MMQAIQVQVPFTTEVTDSAISLPRTVNSVQETAQRSKRKPPPVSSAALETCLRDCRYPRSDPNDPFAPLADLRRRSLSSLQCLSDSINQNVADTSPTTPSSARSSLSFNQRSSHASPLPVKRESSYIAFPSSGPEAVSQTSRIQRNNHDVEVHINPHIFDVHQHDYHYQPWMKRQGSASSLVGVGSVTMYSLAPPSYSYTTVSQRQSLVVSPQPDFSRGSPNRSEIFTASSGFKESTINSKPSRTTSKLPSPLFELMCRTRSNTQFYKAGNQSSGGESVPVPAALEGASGPSYPASPKRLTKAPTSPLKSELDALKPHSLQKLKIVSDSSLSTTSKSPLGQPTTPGSKPAKNGPRSRTLSLLPRYFMRQHGDSATPVSPKPPSYDSAMSDMSQPPSLQQLSLAASSYVVAESGVRIRFGSLWGDRRSIVLLVPNLRCFILLQATVRSSKFVC